MPGKKKETSHKTKSVGIEFHLNVMFTSVFCAVVVVVLHLTTRIINIACLSVDDNKIKHWVPHFFFVASKCEGTKGGNYFFKYFRSSLEHHHRLIFKGT